MNILSGFFTEDLAIDLGTVNTVVYTPTQGVVLNEPSVVAVNKYSREVISVGSAALKLLGREPNDTEVYRPLRRGAIDNFEISQVFLRAIISRVQKHDHPKRSHLVVGVPGSSTPLERRSVRDAARDAKAGRVDLIDEGLAAAIGGDRVWDAARILRLPGTRNWKSDPAMPVRLLRFAPKRRYLFGSFADLISKPEEPKVYEPRETSAGWSLSHPDQPKFGEGQRNNSLARLGGIMLVKGLSPDEIEMNLLAENQIRCNPPLPDREVIQIAHSLRRYA